MEDGTGAYQVYCGLDKRDFKVVDNPASSTQDEPPHGVEARRDPQEPRALQLGDGHGGARPKILGGTQTSLKSTWEPTRTSRLERNIQQAPEPPKDPRTTA